MELVLTAPSPQDNRFAMYRDLIERGHRWACKTVWNIEVFEIGWDMRDAAQLRRHLDSNPDETLAKFAQALLNYFSSRDHSSGERPFRFLPRIDCYRVKPQNVFRRDQDAEIETAQSQRPRRNNDAFARARRDRQLPERHGEDVSAEDSRTRRNRTLASGLEPLPGQGD